MSKGLRIKELREAKGLTQEELAKLLNTKRQTVSKYEQGIVTNIPSDRIEAMARILETTPEYILGWETMSPEAQKNSDAIADITTRLFSDTAFFTAVNSLCELRPDQFKRASELLDLFFKEAHNKV